MNIVNVVPIKKLIINKIPTLGIKGALTKFPKPKSKILCGFAALDLRVSGKKKAVIKRAISPSTLDAKNEAPKEICCANKLIVGPKIKPKPNAVPRTPKPLARFSGVVTSEITAWATELLPPVIPSKNRAKNRMVAVVAVPAIKFATTVPAKLIINKGFLPNRSASLPITGVAKNWEIE